MAHTSVGGLIVPEESLQWKFVRSSGPGGQNVNKVATAVELKFDIQRARLDPRITFRLYEIAANRINSEGCIVLRAENHRHQNRNRRAVLEKLGVLLRQAQQPKKKRVASRPTRASIKRRLENKKRLSAKKKNRSRVSYSDE